MTFRFAPKTEESCVRVNVGGISPKYEIHVPSSMGQAMSGSPSLTDIATIAWLETDRSYEEVCEVLDVTTYLKHGALFVSGNPPVDPARPGGGQGVYQYEQDVQDRLDDEPSE